MAATIFLHIGLPKTATTYLQTIMWGNKDALSAQGVLLPGPERRFHYWCTRIVRGDATFAKRANPRQLEAWDRVRAEIAEWPGTAILSHEFFAAATDEQAARMVEQLVADNGGAEVHLVVTGREPLGLFTASWQEYVKNRGVITMAQYSLATSDDPSDVWNWRGLDLRLVLERWGASFPAERVHVLPLPGRSAPEREIWDRFARLVGVDPDSVDLGRTFPNVSMGVVEAETLRRINKHLGSFNSAIDRGTYIRTFLADERLVPRGGERFWPSPERIEEIRARGRAAVEHIEASGYDVVGDLSALLVPEQLPARRTPETVTEAEVAEVAVELVATMLDDVRQLRHDRRVLRAELDAVVERARRPSLRLALVTRFPWTGRFVKTPGPT
jgi:hypothetical protein